MGVYVYMETITDVYNFFKLEQKIHHPQVAVIDFSELKAFVDDETKVSGNFYALIFKNHSTKSVKYGRKVVDFHDGSMICLAPNQVLELDVEEEDPESMSGYGLFFHPDFLRLTTLHDKMKDYSFFSYEVSEALHLSEKEKQILQECIIKIQTELKENIDIHSQAILASSIELLMNYCSRFYGRQFITRKTSNHFIVSEIEKLLIDYFKANDISEKGLPTVKYLAEQVHLSPGYLSDLLKKETGKNTQDHIHYYLIEEAKSILLRTNKSVGEIAYSLGFEYPQYFNKLFKQKTRKTPVEFRNLN